MRKFVPQFACSNRTQAAKTKKNVAVIARATSSAFEKLEERTLMSTSYSLGSNGILTLKGDPTVGTRLTVAPNANSSLLGVGADQGHVGTVNKASVKGISIVGGSGADYIYIDQSIAIPTTIVGGDGNDQVRTGSSTVSITEGNGNDYVQARGSSNYLKLGDGNNTAYTGNGNDTVIAGNGNNFIDGGSGNDSIVLGNGNDSVMGELGNDTIVAGNGKNSLNGGLGNDSLTSGTGVSTLIPGSGTNYVKIGNGGDTVVYSAGNNTIVNASGQVATPSSTPSTTTASTTWNNTSATKSSDSTAPQAVMGVLAPMLMTGIAVNVRALDSVLGSGSMITSNFQWNFGDTSGAHNSMSGFNASHIYDKAGTYTISLTVTNQLGKKSTVTKSITIAADSRKMIYVDSSAGNDSNNGSSTTAAVKTFLKASQLAGNNTEILFKAGLKYTTNSTFTMPYSNIVIGSYGTGAKPIILLNEISSGAVQFSTQGNTIGATIQNLTFDSATTSVAYSIVSRGTDISIRNCTFNRVLYAVNDNGAATALTVMDNSAPVANGVYGYFLWDQSNYSVLVGNTVNGVHNEHVLRASSATNMLIADNDFTNNNGKGCIELHNGANAWVDGNTIRNGDIRTGPLGLWGESASSATDNVVIQNNHVMNSLINVFPGSHHIMIRNNIINRDSVTMIDIQGTDNSGRLSSDVEILNNTGYSNGTSGNFLRVESHTNGILLENNLLVQPNLAVGGYGAAPVTVTEPNLSSFSYVSNNVWQQPKTFYSYAAGGINYVNTSAQGYLTPAAWNALSQVGGDLFSGTSINTSTYAPASSSVAASAGSVLTGVFADFNGKTRPTTGKWTAGAVQL